MEMCVTTARDVGFSHLELRSNPSAIWLFITLEAKTPNFSDLVSYSSARVSGESQKFKRCYQHLTPAMKMGLTSTQLPWRELIIAPIAEDAHEFPTSTVL